MPLNIDTDYKHWDCLFDDITVPKSKWKIKKLIIKEIGCNDTIHEDRLKYKYTILIEEEKWRTIIIMKSAPLTFSTQRTFPHIKSAQRHLKRRIVYKLYVHFLNYYNFYTLAHMNHKNTTIYWVSLLEWTKHTQKYHTLKLILCR